jgi:pre-mRNA-splicing factor ATP-dependent RNA helicase DHX16
VDIDDPALSLEDETAVSKCLLEGYFTNLAKRTKGGYRTLRQQQTVQLHPSSVLFRDPPPLVLYSEMVLTSQ